MSLIPHFWGENPRFPKRLELFTGLIDIKDSFYKVLYKMEKCNINVSINMEFRCDKGPFIYDVSYDLLVK